MPPIDVARARADTPGCRRLVHFNNAGAALPTATTLRTQIEHLELEARIGGYEAQDAETDRIQGVYDSIARLVNGEPGEVAPTTSNTARLDLFVYSLPWTEGDRLLTTQTEYGGNYVAYLHLARAKGISVNHVPTNGGLVNPATAIGCDAVTATGRKFLRGPRGTGFLWVRRSLLETIHPITIDHDATTSTSPTTYELKPDASRFETWERSWAGFLGLGAAVDDALTWGLAAIRDRVVDLAATLRERLAADVPDAEVRDLGRQRCGIVTFSLGDRDVDAVKDGLRHRRINVSVAGPKCALLDALDASGPEAARDFPR